MPVPDDYIPQPGYPGPFPPDLGSFQPLNENLTEISDLTTDAFGRGLLPQTSAVNVRSYIGAGESGFDGAFSSLTGIPTTIAGYGITNAQPLDADLTAIAALTTDPFGRGLLINVDAAAVRSYIGAGTSNFDGLFASLTSKPTTIAGYGITDFNSLGDARWQLLDPTLTALAALTITANSLTIGAGADTFSQTAFAANTFPARASTGSLVAKAITDFGLSLVDDADALTARSTLGLGTMATATAADYLLLAGGVITGGLGIGVANSTANTINIASTGSLKMNGVKLAYGQNTLSNYFFGDAGNPTLASMTGSDNNGVGAGALYALTGGQENNAMGVNSAGSTTTGVNNVAIGRDALLNNTTAGYQVAIGYRALRAAITTGTASVAIGQQALEKATPSSAVPSVAVGYYACNSQTTGYANSAVGVTALQLNTTGLYNMAFGYQALNGIVGSNNCGIGAIAGGINTAGSNNIYLGYNAAANQTAGSKNIIVGAGINAPDATGSNQLNIGNIIFGTGISGTGGTVAGNVGIGIATPNANAVLDVTSTTKAFMPPRMTTTQKNAIASPTAGMVVYDSTLNKLSVRGVSAWETVTSV